MRSAQQRRAAFVGQSQYTRWHSGQSATTMRTNKCVATNKKRLTPRKHLKSHSARVCASRGFINNHPSINRFAGTWHTDGDEARNYHSTRKTIPRCVRFVHARASTMSIALSIISLFDLFVVSIARCNSVCSFVSNRNYCVHTCVKDTLYTIDRSIYQRRASQSALVTLCDAPTAALHRRQRHETMPRALRVMDDWRAIRALRIVASAITLLRMFSYLLLCQPDVDDGNSKIRRCHHCSDRTTNSITTTAAAARYIYKIN